MRNDTAILLFARDPHDEALNKDFSGNHSSKTNVSISEQLVKRTVREIRKSNLPYVIISTDLQHGDGFGERFINAIEDVFSLGYEKVIAIGNDAPQLTSRLLLKASNNLRDNDLVLGPDKRGGIYLLGVSINAFMREKLRSIPWKTDAVYSQFITEAVENEWNVLSLPLLKDVNFFNDLKRMINDKLTDFRFARSIVSIIASVVNKKVLQDFFFSYSRIQKSIFRRGPPRVLYASVS